MRIADIRATTVAIPLERATVIRNREAMLHYDLRQMRDAIDRYKDDADKNLIQVDAGTEGYPPDLQTLVTGVKLSGGTTPVPVNNTAPCGNSWLRNK